MKWETLESAKKVHQAEAEINFQGVRQAEAEIHPKGNQQAEAAIDPQVPGSPPCRNTAFQRTTGDTVLRTTSLPRWVTPAANIVSHLGLKANGVRRLSWRGMWA